MLLLVELVVLHLKDILISHLVKLLTLVMRGYLFSKLKALKFLHLLLLQSQLYVLFYDFFILFLFLKLFFCNLVYIFLLEKTLILS